MHDVIDLPIERVNALSPYKVYINNNGSLGFETQYGSVYEVGFVEDYTFMDENAFQFFILESQGKHSVKDPLVRETIWVILETFFLENNPVILYICDMSDGKQAIRNRLFSMWYYEYEQRESFTFLSTKVEVESTDYYASVLVKNSNPQLEDIKVTFNSFNANNVRSPLSNPPACPRSSSFLQLKPSILIRIPMVGNCFAKAITLSSNHPLVEITIRSVCL